MFASIEQGIQAYRDFLREYLRRCIASDEAARPIGRSAALNRREGGCCRNRRKSSSFAGSFWA